MPKTRTACEKCGTQIVLVTDDSVSPSVTRLMCRTCGRVYTLDELRPKAPGETTGVSGTWVYG